MKLKLKNGKLPKSVYLLVTNDKYEFVVSCCDTFMQMSKETGIPYFTLYSSYRYCCNCCDSRYIVKKVNIEFEEEQQFKFDFEGYSQFCKDNDLKPCDFKSLAKYHQLCDF